ncbi:hypothetical protein DsansV1_C17g0144801 [Dioscorea sansibarensis]
MLLKNTPKSIKIPLLHQNTVTSLGMEYEKLASVLNSSKSFQKPVNRDRERIDYQQFQPHMSRSHTMTSETYLETNALT